MRRAPNRRSWLAGCAVENVMINIQDTTGLGWSATAELVGPRHQDLVLMLNLDLRFIVRPPANGRMHRAAERRRVSVATTAS